jgi:hypothetical protein
MLFHFNFFIREPRYSATLTPYASFYIFLLGQGDFFLLPLRLQLTATLTTSTLKKKILVQVGLTLYLFKLIRAL